MVSKDREMGGLRICFLYEMHGAIYTRDSESCICLRVYVRAVYLKDVPYSTGDQRIHLFEERNPPLYGPRVPPVMSDPVVGAET